MAKYTDLSIEKQEELVRSFIKTYSKYLNRYKLDKNYSKQKGRKYLEGVDDMLDKDGFYIFSADEDSKGHFRISLWIETDSEHGNDFYPITELRWQRFVKQFEERNNIKRRTYK